MYIDTNIMCRVAVGMYVSLDSVEQKFNDILRESGREQSSRQTASTFAQQKSCLESDVSSLLYCLIQIDQRFYS